VWHGDLYLVGGGDPTFGEQTFNRAWEFGYGPTAGQLAGQLRAHGIHRVTGHLIGDGSLFDGRVGPPSTGFGPDVPDLGGQLSALTFDHGSTAGLRPAAFAARQLAGTMRDMQIQVNAAVLPGRAPPGGRMLAAVSSPPMSIVLRLTDLQSDDLFAESLTKQLGARFAGAGTTAAGAGVTSQVIASYGLHPKIVDGSGLSRSDRSSPLQVVQLLRQLYGTDVGRELNATLPVVGVDGTAKMIARDTAAQGHCIAKTGTLDGVTNLAGYCHSRSGKQLAFAVFVDGPSNSRAVQLESKMISALARL
jgi:D-alanyl-D-alanine carboxypeptidase/D-alanyl-D-alanine-endopeptidase (penicillin-binding protein 4)